MKILATSIEGLGLFDETIYQVPSLPLPQAQELSLKELERFASIELFNARASHAKPDFSWNEKNASSIAQICQRLDGIPLAIELAAARIKVLSIDEIAARLDDRFSLLTAGSRTAIPRHQTLRATIDWSYDLLTESERILFRRLSVFAGGFTLEAAESVCSLGGLHRSEILDLLGRLADKSLVIVEGTGVLGQTRYRLLETIRQYAIEKLIATGEASATRDRHLEFYLALAEKAEALLFGREQAPWVRRLDIELDNVRAVIDWATSTGKADIALRIAGSLVYYWFAHRLAASEWQDWVQKALARPEGKRRTLDRAKALNAIGFVYFGDVVLADRRPELEEALSIAKEFDDQLNTATALRNLGLMENVKGNYLEARSYLEASLSLWREMGATGKIGYAWTLIFLGDVALNRGEAELSRTLYEEVVAILRSTGDLNFLAYAIRRLGQLLWREGNYAQAAALCKESLDLNLQVSSPRGVMGCLAGFAAIAVAQGKYQYAAQLIGAIESQMVSQSITPMYMDQQEYARTLARLHAKLDEKTLGKYWAKGKAMTLDETIAFALDET
jgi:non-specific serine/threonine protein kinase